MATNYPLSTAWESDYPEFFGGGSFGANPSGPTLTGGLDNAGTPSLTRPFATFYTYDPLDNLTQVSQGAQTRTYIYNGLGQLTSADTPESDTVNFTYTNAGQVDMRTDARGIVATYSYDGLNRLLGISYSDGTPSISFTYDTGGPAAFALGRLVSMTDGSGSEAYTYDPLGRITQVTKTISGGSGNYVTQYAYNLAGELTAITYPSNRVVNQEYDTIGRLNRLYTGATNYLSAPSYNAAGAPLGFTYGNGVADSFTYNSRLQLASLRYSKTGSPDLLNLSYGYVAGTGNNNNGQIRSITDNGDSSRSMTYDYDAWARLQYATAGPVATPTWKLGMVYDRYGNRTNQNLLAGTGPSSLVTYNPATNRISDAGFAYDPAGNLTNDSFHSYAFDAENRMKSVDGGSLNNGTDYAYDGGSLRVKKVVGTAATTTLYVFSGTKVIAEYAGGAAAGSPAREYIYSGAQLLATIEGATTKYHHPDHLSARVESDGSTGAVTRTSGHFPFGEQWYETGTTSKWQFTGYERDPESGLDYAIFRSYSNTLGRFSAPDPFAGQSQDPQSLNRYPYVRNDPIAFTDPLGLSRRFYWRICSQIGMTEYLRPFEDGGVRTRLTFSCRWEFIGPFEDPNPNVGDEDEEDERLLQEDCAEQVVNSLLKETGAAEIVQSNTLKVSVDPNQRIFLTFTATVENPRSIIPSLPGFIPAGIPDPTNEGRESFRGFESPSLELTPGADGLVTGDVDYFSPITNPIGHLLTDFFGLDIPKPCDVLADLIDQGRFRATQ